MERKLWLQIDAWSHEDQKDKCRQKNVGTILGEINPEAQTKRQNVAGHMLNLKVYYAKYFDGKVHYDQQEKFGMFDVAHVCTRDRFFGKTVGHAIDFNVSIF